MKKEKLTKLAKALELAGFELVEVKNGWSPMVQPGVEFMVADGTFELRVRQSEPKAETDKPVDTKSAETMGISQFCLPLQDGDLVHSYEIWFSRPGISGTLHYETGGSAFPITYRESQ